MKDYAEKILFFQLYLIISLCFNLLWAFPVKWAWNYTMTYIFNLPIITWGHAFCLLFIMRSLWKTVEIFDRKKER